MPGDLRSRSGVLTCDEIGVWGVVILSSAIDMEACSGYTEQMFIADCRRVVGQ